MRFAIDSKIIAFVLMCSLPDTPDWFTFASSVLNTITEKDLTFNAIETRVIAEVAYQPVDASTVHTAASMMIRTKLCTLHQTAMHDTCDCNVIKEQSCTLKEGKKSNWEDKKKKDKAKKADSPADSDSEVDTKSTTVRECVHISKALAKHVQAYSVSVTKDYLDIIINSGTSLHMVPHHTCFSDDSTVYAIGKGTVTFYTTIKRQVYDVELSNALHIPTLAFTISLISVSKLAHHGCPHALTPQQTIVGFTKALASLVLTAKHKSGLYHVEGAPLTFTDQVLMTVDINLLH
ncbi:hypothetical protein BDR07DRAFT_1303923 [Suillus spraguei]|nr:hypothetical protein BDR07DRAFT_1303923 [Suillus spraguei]